jgi:hypothetical protein
MGQADRIASRLEVHDAAASLDGDTAMIALFTDHGPVTLQMHRRVLGALGGTIARSLWPKPGEHLVAFAGTGSHNDSFRPDAQETAAPVV